MGDFKDDKKDGLGNLTLASGNNYVGGFSNSKFDGEGVYKWKSGQVYSGSWKDNKRNGEGNLTLANGDNYVGNFIDDKKDGEGIYEWNRELYRYSYW